jgi:signal transduction histidine kinase
MTRQTARVRIPSALDMATYIGLAAMSLLGVSGLHTLELQLIALGLCMLFGILYHTLFRTGRYRRHPNLYFGVQTIVLSLVLLLGSSNTDAFNFLLLLLAIHTALVLPAWPAAIWIAAYYLVINSIVVLSGGSNGIYAALFYLVAYVVCGFFGYVLQQAELARDRNQRLVEELQATQQKLKELAVLEERNRLARDLHDSVKQQVFAISMQLSAARIALSENDQAYQPVVEAERLAQQAGTELTSLIHQLRPPGLVQKTLADAVREYVDDWVRQNNIKAETDIDPELSLSVEAEQVLFRVLQEALSNVARHSQAGQVSVTLRSESGHVKLMVQDDGVGYDAGRITQGVGLDSMRERLAAANGDLEISSRKSRGTLVIATVRSQ